MSYLWQEFNIKTFPSETLVFRDGVFCEDLSDYESAVFENNTIKINKTSQLPIHIIYIGEIAGKIDLNIEIISPNNTIFMTNKIINKKPAFLNIFIKNTGKNSLFSGKIIVKNHNSLKIDIFGQHNCENTGILVKTRVAAYNGSETELNGRAEINFDKENCKSDISFSVLADDNAKIIMKPTQYIKSIPESAIHSASLYKPKDSQINYLRNAGLSGDEIKQILEQAFLDE